MGATLLDLDAHALPRLSGGCHVSQIARNESADQQDMRRKEQAACMHLL